MNATRALDALCGAVAGAAGAKARLVAIADNVAHRANQWPYVARPRLTLGYVASMGDGWRALALRSLQRQRLNSQH